MKLLSSMESEAIFDRFMKIRGGIFMATRAFHTFLRVSDLKRSIEFYTKAFEGAKMLYEFTIDGLDICMFSLGNGVVLEIYLKIGRASCRERV